MYPTSKADVDRSRELLSRGNRGLFDCKLANLCDAAAAHDTGTLVVTGSTQTVGDWVEFWLESIAAARVRPPTLHSYRGYVRNRIVPAMCRHRFDRLQLEHVEAFYRQSLQDNLAPATVLQMHRILSRALKVAMRRGRVPRNVATLVDAPTVRRTEVAPLAATTARQVLAAAAGDRNAARWSVALALGLRQGETLGLQWDDLDLDRARVTVSGRSNASMIAGSFWSSPRAQPGDGPSFYRNRSASRCDGMSGAGPDG